MADFQTRGPGAGDAFRLAPSRPAGLYGELPPLPLEFLADRPGPALTPRSRHRIQRAD